MFEDHKKLGKKFIPAMSDKFQRIDFVEFILPEIVWIGFLLEFHGDQDGIRLATRLIEITDQEVFARPKPVFSLISAHRLLSSEDKERICKQLHQDDVLSKLRAGLGAAKQHFFCKFG